MRHRSRWRSLTRSHALIPDFMCRAHRDHHQTTAASHFPQILRGPWQPAMPCPDPDPAKMPKMPPGVSLPSPLALVSSFSRCCRAGQAMPGQGGAQANGTERSESWSNALPSRFSTPGEIYFNPCFYGVHICRMASGADSQLVCACRAVHK